MDKIIENWQQRTASEKKILTVVGVFLIVSLFYLFIFDPVISWREQEKKRLVANEKILTTVTSLASRFKNLSSVDSEASKGLASIIDKSLQKNNLSMKGFQPGKNNDARLRLSNVPYQPLTQWLYELEYTHHISIEELTISQAKDQGLLMVSVRVAQ